ncbi:MAG: peptide deformylase [Bacilli bacterium]|nr:peptide deformylase [Bacilli bacterium]
MLKRITIEDNEEYLRQISINVDFDKDNYNEYIDNLREFCQNNEVYALAPVQIGIPKRIIYIRNTTTDMTKNNDEAYNEGIVYINPIIRNMYGHTQFLEGCASCKYKNGNYITGLIDRPYKIEIEYYDVYGKKQNKTIEGFESTIFCHEYDHLNGILHMDRINDSTLMNLNQMKEFRTNNPYKVIDQDEIFSYDEINKIRGV